MAAELARELPRSPDQLTAVIGVSDVIVVTTQDAVLVLNASEAHRVKDLVTELKARGRPEAVEHKRVYRPWGHYQSIDAGERHQVKRIVVRPNGRLSLQKHFHRAEHWVVVRGTARVPWRAVVRGRAAAHRDDARIGRARHWLAEHGFEPART